MNHAADGKRPDSAGDPGGRRLLSLDATYSLALIRARKLEHEITCRDLDGYFDYVWSVHPLVGASPEHVIGYGGGAPAEIADRHSFIEGTVAWSPRLVRFPTLNFLVAQVHLFLQLHRLVRRERIAVIRVGDPYYLGIFGMLLSRLNGLPLVVRVNCNYDNAYADCKFLAYPRLFRWHWLHQAILRFVLARADLVAPGSRDNLVHVLDNGAKPERSTIWGYGTWVDPLHFEVEPEDRRSVREDLGLLERPFIILVSRLEVPKHPEDVVRVLAEGKRRCPALAAVIVGDGSMRQELEELAVRLGVSEDLHVVGYRDQPWLASALTSADVVVSTLTGRALVEACLSGTAVVAYDVEWHSELIRSDDTGTLVPYRDVEAMANAVCDLLENFETRVRLGRRARDEALKTMDPAKLMALERADYDELLARWATRKTG